MTMAEIRIRSDRRVDSTDNNGFADGTRDETAIAADLTEEVSVDEEIPEALDEAVMQAVNAFAGEAEQADDITVLTLLYHHAGTA